MFGDRRQRVVLANVCAASHPFWIPADSEGQLIAVDPQVSQAKLSQFFYFRHAPQGKATQQGICFGLANVFGKHTVQASSHIACQLVHSEPRDLQNLIVNGAQRVKRPLLNGDCPFEKIIR